MRDSPSASTADLPPRFFSVDPSDTMSAIHLITAGSASGEVKSHIRCEWSVQCVAGILPCCLRLAREPWCWAYSSPFLGCHLDCASLRSPANWLRTHSFVLSALSCQSDDPQPKPEQSATVLIGRSPVIAAQTSSGYSCIARSANF